MMTYDELVTKMEETITLLGDLANNIEETRVSDEVVSEKDETAVRHAISDLLEN